MEDHVNHSIEDRRQLRQQEQKTMAETSNLALSLTRPMIQQQKALVQFWADTVDAWINNYERTIEAVSSAAQQQARQGQQQSNNQNSQQQRSGDQQPQRSEQRGEPQRRDEQRY